jgi:hypothetical protein
MNRARVSWLAGALILVACTQAAGVTLRYRFKPDQVFRYKQMMSGAAMMTLSGESEPARSTMEGTGTVKSVVLSVSPDGTARIRQEDLGGQMRVTTDGEEHTVPMPREQYTITMSPTGKVTRERKPGAAAGREEGQSLLGDIVRALEFPKKDLKVGETWTTTLKVPVQSVGRVPVAVTQKLAEITKFKGRQCAVVDVTFEAPFSLEQQSVAATGKMTGSGKIYFDFTKGVEVESSLSVVQQVKVTATVGGDAREFKQTSKMNLKQYLLQ